MHGTIYLALRTWDGANEHLGLAELGVISSDDNVTHHGQLAAAAQGVAIHRRDDLERRGRVKHGSPTLKATHAPAS